MQDYTSLCVAAMVHAAWVNTQTFFDWI